MMTVSFNWQLLTLVKRGTMASEDITKLAESLAKTKVDSGQLSFKGQSLKLNTAEDGKRKYPCALEASP